MLRFTRDFGASMVSRGFEMKPNVGRVAPRAINAPAGRCAGEILAPRIQRAAIDAVRTCPRPDVPARRADRGEACARVALVFDLPQFRHPPPP